MSRGFRLAGAALAAALALPGCRPSRPGAAAKLAVLEDILRSRNDNDPRLDRDFIGLEEDAKRLFRDKYRLLERERLNERGTIVYLLGKNLVAPEDWAFFREVAAEPPCLSLSDCAKPAAGGGQPGDEVTLAYPSLVALRQARRAADEGGSRPEALSVIRAGKASKVRAVARLASTLEAGFGRMPG